MHPPAVPTETSAQLRADRYMESPADPAALARDLAEIVRTGQFRPPLRHPCIAASVVPWFFVGSRCPCDPELPRSS
jgi:hypothetical protein